MILSIRCASSDLMLAIWIFVVLFRYPTIGGRFDTDRMKRRDENRFSGLYRPPNKETFAGAYFVTKDRFIDAKSINYVSKRQPWQIEGVVVAYTSIDPNSFNLMTRDYFDFQVLHLSSTLTQTPRQLLLNPGIQNEILYRMRQTLTTLQEQYRLVISYTSNSTESDEYNEARRNTLGIVVFSSAAGTINLDPKSQETLLPFTTELKQLFLKSTIFSIARYFPRILVATGTDQDLQLVQMMKLPLWKTVNLASKVSHPTLLPKETILYVNHELKHSDDIGWKQVKYLYYSEMDQILYARSLAHLYRSFDEIDFSVVMVPHRMQTFSLPKSFHGLEEEWYKFWDRSKVEDLRKVELVVEDAWMPKGSCCDDGRFVFGNCGNWWYNCPSYGLQNYTTWARFGDDGFTIPLATPHSAKCIYHSKKRKCPKPLTCKRKNPRHRLQLCGEMGNNVTIP